MLSKSYNSSHRTSLLNTIASLAQQIQILAPHPEKPDYKGPLFVRSNSHARVASEHDGMLGTMMLEAITGAAVSDALSDSLGSWSHSIDFANALECYSEYITDIEGKRDQQDENHKRAHGQGTLARLSSKKIANSFNLRGSLSAGMQAFLDDMPKRMKLESNLAYYLRQLEMLDAPMPAFVPSVPVPSFAA